jgi:hypothetical protein
MGILASKNLIYRNQDNKAFFKAFFFNFQILTY